MPLPASEHARVRDETRTLRNRAARNRRAALVRAGSWLETFGAEVRADATPTGILYTVRLTGFHPASDRLLTNAVDALHANVTTFVRSGAAKGPTGASMERVREAYARWLGKTEGVC